MELDLLRLSSLLADVLLDSFASATVADGSYVVAIGPELSSPELCFDLGKLETGCCREGLDPTNDLSTGVLGEALAENVDVVLIEANVVDIDGKTILEASEDIEDRVDHVLFEDGLPVLDRQLDVVVALGDVVVPMPEVTVDIGHSRGLYLFAVCVWGTRNLRAPSGALAQGKEE